MLLLFYYSTCKIMDDKNLWFNKCFCGCLRSVACFDYDDVWCTDLLLSDWTFFWFTVKDTDLLLRPTWDDEGLFLNVIEDDTGFVALRCDYG